MAQIQNYNKICDKCNGNHIIWGYRQGFFGKVPVIVSVCDKCKLGVIKPKQIIQRVDRFEPEIIY